MSHTVTVDVKFKNQEVAVKVAESMGALVLGNGSHRLYSSSHTGTGIHLRNWQYPIVIDADGKMFYDNFNGRWGDSKDVEAFQEAYARGVIEAECAQLGWYCEPNDQGELIVHHPSGGTITVQKGGTLDASNFVGNSCEHATERFEAALGTKLGSALKPYLNEIQVRQTES